MPAFGDRMRRLWSSAEGCAKKRLFKRWKTYSRPPFPRLPHMYLFLYPSL